MTADERPPWLPEGWTAVTKTTRSGAVLWCFHDPKTGVRFCSQKEVLKYLNGENFGSHATKTRCMTTRSMEKKCASIKSEENEKNSTENIFSGKVAAKSEEDRKMDSTINVCSGENPTKENKKMESSINVEDQIKRSPGELPHGWIKEIKFRKCGIKADPLYIDPASGYEFRSLKDVYRYIETGDVHNCVNKPRKRNIRDINGVLTSQNSSAKIVDWNETAEKTCQFRGGTENSDVKSETGIKGSLDAGAAASSCMKSVDTKQSDGFHVKKIKMVVDLSSMGQEHKVSGETLEFSKQAMEPAVVNQSITLNSCLSESQNETLVEPSVTNQMNMANPSEIPYGSGLIPLDGNLLGEANFILNKEELDLKKKKRARERELGKSHSRRTISMPLRASPRLAVVGVDTVSKSVLVEEPRTNKKLHHQLLANSSTQDHSVKCIPAFDQHEISFVESERLKKLDKKTSIGEEATIGKLNELQGMSKNETVSELASLFENSWPDPCLEFAFKTLMGDIPILDNTGIFQDFSHQQQLSSANSQCPRELDAFVLHNSGFLSQNEHLPQQQVQPPNNSLSSFRGNTRTCLVENGLQSTKKLKEVHHWRP